jgi:hypothetical protein
VCCCSVEWPSTSPYAERGRNTAVKACSSPTASRPYRSGSFGLSLNSALCPVQAAPLDYVGRMVDSARTWLYSPRSGRVYLLEDGADSGSAGRGSNSCPQPKTKREARGASLFVLLGIRGPCYSRAVSRRPNRATNSSAVVGAGSSSSSSEKE